MTMPTYNPLAQRERETRVHLDPPNWLWGRATDYWFYAGSADMVTASGATNLSGLDSFGWTTTALSLSAATGGDFLSSAGVGTPSAIVFGASGDLLQSPSIFGDYAGGLWARQSLGRTPTQLIMDCYAAFTDASADENRSGFGFVEAGGSPATANDALAMIVSDSTTFLLRSGATTSGAGAAVDNAYHFWRIIIDATNATCTMDGGNSISVATEADLFPASFGAHVLTTNRLALVWAHVYYA